MRHPFMSRPSDDRLARQVAQAAGSFEHLLLGRAPRSVMVVSHNGWMVVCLHESLSAVERRLATKATGSARVEDFHQYLFDQSLDSLRNHVRCHTGVELRGALAHVDAGTGSVFKTLTTGPCVELFLLGQPLPTLGVPVNDHLQSDPAHGQLYATLQAHVHVPPYSDGAGGNGAVREGICLEGSATMKKVPHVGADEEESRKRRDRSA
ncbi:MAG: hypothetical protein RLZZ111_1578 [Planctomycetota bacterium]